MRVAHEHSALTSQTQGRLVHFQQIEHFGSLPLELRLRYVVFSGREQMP